METRKHDGDTSILPFSCLGRIWQLVCEHYNSIMLGVYAFFVSGVEQIGDIPLATCTRTSFRLRSSELFMCYVSSGGLNMGSTCKLHRWRLYTRSI